MTQKEAVYIAVTSVLNSAGIGFSPGNTNVNVILDRHLRSEINSILVNQFVNGEIEVSEESKEKLADLANLRSYVSSLVSNWIRKDSRLNGGSIKQPVRRAKVVNNDPQLKALRHLLTVQIDPAKRNEIQGYIDKRVEELS